MILSDKAIYDMFFQRILHHSMYRSLPNLIYCDRRPVKPGARQWAPGHRVRRPGDKNHTHALDMGRGHVRMIALERPDRPEAHPVRDMSVNTRNT